MADVGYLADEDEEAFFSAEEDDDGDCAVKTPHRGAKTTTADDVFATMVGVVPTSPQPVRQSSSSERDMDSAAACQLPSVADTGGLSRPTSLKSAVVPHSGPESSESDSGTPSVVSATTLPQRPPAKRQREETDDGWDVGDWGVTDDFGADEMVTPREELPAVSPRSVPMAAKLKRSGRSSADEPAATVDDWESFLVASSSSTSTGSRKRSERKSQLPATGHHQRAASTSPSRSATSLWGGWSSLVSAAADSLNQITTTVEEGISDVLETVETAVGAPTPKEFAQMTLEERQALSRKVEEIKEPWPSTDHDDCDSATEEIFSDGGSDDACGVGVGLGDSANGGGATSSGYQSDGSGPPTHRRDDPASALAPLMAVGNAATATGGGLVGLFSGVTNTLVTGSLDVLESIGKKTFETLTVVDESATVGRRRIVFTQQKPNLSKVLKELKAKAEHDAHLTKELEASLEINYAHLFEKYEGLANLEGLEMLSGNCTKQLESLLKRGDRQILEDEIDECAVLFDSLKIDGEDVEQQEEFVEQLGGNLRSIGLTFNPSKILGTHQRHTQWTTDVSAAQELGQEIDVQEIHKNGVHCLAEFTANSVEMFHKLGQLLLVATNRRPNVDAFVALDATLKAVMGDLNGKFVSCLNWEADKASKSTSASEFITNLFLEANNSVQYVHEALLLLKPIVELRLCQHCMERAAE